MHLTDTQAKPAVPFGGKYRVIDFPLSNCVNSGIRRIGVATQYKAHSLIRHVQNGWSFLRGELDEFVELWPAQQQTAAANWYLGTADAVYQNIETIKAHRPDYILILAGDHIYKQDYSKVVAQHIKRGAEVTVSCVAVPFATATDFGVVGVDKNDAVIDFLEKPANPPAIPDQPHLAFASMGIYVFNAEYLYELLTADAADSASAHDFGKNILPGLVSKRRLMAHRFSESSVTSGEEKEPYWRDIGTITSYWAANIDLTTFTPDLDLYDTHWPIWTHQAQQPSAKFVFDDVERRGMAVDSLVSGGCIISGGAVRRSLLFTNVHVHSYSEITNSVILPNCKIGRHARLGKAIVDHSCQIPEGMVVGEDPKLDAERFYRTESGVTLVTAAMLETL
jgi:glucose-1-phosphate adenylyltransferase